MPPHYNGTAIPLVVALHGLGENYATNFQSEISLDAVADAQTFAVVYPLGSESISPALFGHTWNGGKCCFSDANDHDFVLEVVTRTHQLVTVDAKRVYAVGFSAGGVMSHELACTASDVFAAITSVDGPIELKSACTPTRPISVMHFHGTLDPIFPYGGTPLYNGALQTLAAWRTADACTGAPTNATLDWRVHSQAFTCGGLSEVRLVTITGGSHAWPPQDIKPCEYIWAFLSRFALN